MKSLPVTALALAAALLLSTQAGAAKSQANKVTKTAKPIRTLAMDGSRVAYASGGKVRVWNVTTGATSGVKGHYAGVSQIAIAGKRVAWIRDQQFGNTEEGEKLYTASLGGPARLVYQVHRYGTDDASSTTGGWIDGLAGSGPILAVSTWKSDGTVATEKALSLVTGAGLQGLASGPGAIVAQSVDGGHIAVLRSSPWATSTSVGIYSRAGSAPVGHVDLGPPDPDTTVVHAALSGSRLVVLTTTLEEPFGLTSVKLAVYDWTTGQLKGTWPVGISSGGEVSFAVHGRLAAVEGASMLHLVDLTTGKDVTIARTRHTVSPPAFGAGGLVYALNPRSNGSGKLVFVPTAKLLARLS